MKRLFLIPFALLLLSCKQPNNPSKDSSLYQDYDYDDVEERFISWLDLLNFDGNYYCYIFSPYCRHCENIKQIVISKELAMDTFYFIRFDKDVIPIIKNPELTIGQNDISQIGIIGTPTLMEIDNYSIKVNIAGEKAIVDFLKKI